MLEGLTEGGEGAGRLKDPREGLGGRSSRRVRVPGGREGPRKKGDGRRVGWKNGSKKAQIQACRPKRRSKLNPQMLVGGTRDNSQKQLQLRAREQGIKERGAMHTRLNGGREAGKGEEPDYGPV